MPFIDWNGNGKINPVDIGISIVMDNDEEIYLISSQKRGCRSNLSIQSIIKI